jgi:membrane protease YdiL (CAAX protease family)
MTPLDIFLNKQDRLRSGWRLALFWALNHAVAVALVTTIYALVFLATHETRDAIFGRLTGALAYPLQFFIMFVPAVVLGWACGRLFDGVPWRALGWTIHRGWLHNFLWGTLLGASALALAALIATVGRGFHFTTGAPGLTREFAKTFIGAAGVYVLLGAGEEALFRGYPLQTMMRSLPFIIAVLPSSILFAYVHLDNPHLPTGARLVVMILNTALAGVWMAVGYWRTRSMWLPLGLHWAWNWTMGSLLGLPVSGITSLTSAPLLRATDAGPAWLTGGTYGLEGGLACTAALILATIFLWRTRLLKPAEELKRFTDGEQPKKNTIGESANQETANQQPA